MPQRPLLPLFVLLFATSAVAEELPRFQLGANLWSQQFEARARAGGDYVDFDSAFDIDDEEDFQYYLAMDLPTRWAPHVIVQHTRSATDGDGVVTTTIFDKIEFEGDVRGKLDLTHSDVTVLYPVIERAVQLDLGFSVRVFDASVELINERGQRGKFVIDDVVPLAVARAHADLPWGGLFLRADGKFIKYDSDRVWDYRLTLGWQSTFGLGAEFGYRYMDIDYGVTGGLLEATVDGPYGGLSWRF